MYFFNICFKIVNIKRFLKKLIKIFFLYKSEIWETLVTLLIDESPLCRSVVTKKEYKMTKGNENIFFEKSVKFTIK